MPAICGNSKEGSEGCDDGNITTGDGWRHLSIERSDQAVAAIALISGNFISQTVIKLRWS